MKLSRLLEGIASMKLARPGEDPELTGLAEDSRNVTPGCLFFALAGDPETAGIHARQALERGASALVLPPGVCLDGDFTRISSDDCRAALADAAARYFAPTPKLPVIGVTGTNGKTTTSLMIRSILTEAGHRPAVIGTLGTLRHDGSQEESPNTTPGLMPLYATFRSLEETGHTAIVMEVSSQGIAQHRIRGIPFAAAAWTNLSPEHFELHGDLETYSRIKESFFQDCTHRPPVEGAPPFCNVLNRDDSRFPRFQNACRGEILTFGRAEDARVRARNIAAGIEGSQFELVVGGNALPVTLPLGGAFNVENALAAAAVCHGLGIPTDTLVRGLERMVPVPGRFQAVGDGSRRVIVDYAHSSDGLQKLLAACRSLVSGQGRLLVVFGCGGDRDRTKRPKMGRVASRYGDLSIITNDNPRTESPEQIVEEILAGIPDERRPTVTVELDRRRAIRAGLAQTGPEDLLVIAGKGHEDYQILGTSRIHFDDREVVAAELTALGETT